MPGRKREVGLCGLLSALFILDCAKPQETAARDATASRPTLEARGAPARGSGDLDGSTLAGQRLSSLRQEMLRVSQRLEREGSPDERARWAEQLSAIDHDCTELTSRWQQAQLLPQADRAASESRLVPMIDMLYTVNARTAAQIDESLDAMDLVK